LSPSFHQSEALKWERPQRSHRRALTPARVRQAFPPLLVASTRLPTRQNPAGGRRAAHSAAGLVPPDATWPSRRLP